MLKLALWLLMLLAQIDLPNSSVQVSSASQNLKLLGIANCYRGVLESDCVSLIAKLANRK
jgi:hypothetical protein